MVIFRVLLFAFLACMVRGALLFANLFQGGAVLQRDTTVAIWGTGIAGATVALHLDGTHVADSFTDIRGKWNATLPRHAASRGNTLVAQSADGNSSITISFGDVLLCSGQSNMDMPVVGKFGSFQADNGTAEAAAAGRYAGGIWLWRQLRSKQRAAWTAASPAAVKAGFSAVCWYTGKMHYERLEGLVPVGLIQASVGGSPIEAWLSAESISTCVTGKVQCTSSHPNSVYHNDQIVSLQPYTLGAIIWDQGERDLKCDHLEWYPCMQRELAQSWRYEFLSVGVPFLVVQLPDYYDPDDPGAAGVPGYASMAEGLFKMRLAQEQGLVGAQPSASVASYDQSCNDLEFPQSCPFGSVHNTHKQEVALRLVAQLARLMHGQAIITDGPRARVATSHPVSSGGHSVTVGFLGGTQPFLLKPTRNCTECCDGSFGTAAPGDFDVSHNGSFWAPGTNVRMAGDDSIVFHTELPHSEPPVLVRYTAGSNFTQCALYNAEGLPVWPFQLEISATNTFTV